MPAPVPPRATDTVPVVKMLASAVTFCSTPAPVMRVVPAVCKEPVIILTSPPLVIPSLSVL